mmetsp:Transcript_11870/g.33483  ORF Transcript_11870/g.33483 Transcript_11870/m.33483 type:complete len:754 (+) Transcript_11870:189-2450(+)
MGRLQGSAVAAPSALVLSIVVALALVASGACKPEQLHVSVHRQKNTLLFFWATSKRTDESCVKFSTDKSNLWQQSCQDGDKQFRHGYRSYDSPWLHEMEVYGFWCGKKYFYRVGGKDGGWSDLFSFVTRPCEPDADIRFVSVGDQDVTSGTRRVVDRILDMNQGYHFLLQLGDLSYADGDLDMWDKFGERVEPVAARLPGIYAVGNHEDDGRGRGFDAYLTRWRNGEGDDDEFWWSVDFGPVHIAVLSSEHDYGSRSPQLRWLEADLREANEAGNRLLRPWIFVAVHRPMYTSGAHGSNTRMRRTVEPLLEKYGVQIVLTGHDHDYERIYPMSDGDIMSRDKGKPSKPYISAAFAKNGPGLHPIHLVLGTGGRGVRRCRDRSWTASDDCYSIHGFSEFVANRREIRFKFYDTEGDTVDEFRMCSRQDCNDPPPIPAASNGKTGKVSPDSAAPQPGITPARQTPEANARVAGSMPMEVVVADYFQYQNPEAFLVNTTLLKNGFLPDPRNASAYELSFMMRFPSMDFESFEHDPRLLQQFSSDYKAVLAAAAGVLARQVRLLSISPGSVLVDSVLIYLLEDGSAMGTVAASLDRMLALSQHGLSQNATFMNLYGPSAIEEGSLLVSLARPYSTVPQNPLPWLPQQSRPTTASTEEWSAATAPHETSAEQKAGAGMDVLLVACVMTGAAVVVGLLACAIAVYLRRSVRTREKPDKAADTEAVSLRRYPPIMPVGSGTTGVSSLQLQIPTNVVPERD